MDINSLRQNLFGRLDDHERKLLANEMRQMRFVYPFTELDYVLVHLMDRGLLTKKEYIGLKTEFYSSNQYIHLFAMGQKNFGQCWGEKHVRELDPRFSKPHGIDLAYHNEYDLIIEGIKTEVKATRAIDKNKKGTLVSKAIPTKSPRPFFLNFQRLRPDFADAYVWIGVWTDELKYWVLTNEEVKSNKYLYNQQANEKQIAMTPKNIGEFDQFAVKPEELAETLIKKARAYSPN